MAARKGSFSAAAEELGASPAYVSKRIGILEDSLGVRLFHRTTRHMSITEEGAVVLRSAIQILDSVDELIQRVSATRTKPRGLLRISSSFGFGRNVVARMVHDMVTANPGLQVRLEVFDRIVDVASEGFDLDIRVGDDIAPHLVARRLASNHRVLLAAPSYLQRRGRPRQPIDLMEHDCIVIKERDHSFGVWRLCDGARDETVKVAGTLSSNNGEIAAQWAAQGQGIVLRSTWNLAPLLAAGQLQQVMPGWYQEANIWAVYPPHLKTSAKVRACVDFLRDRFAREHPSPQV
jgi:LysR family transcriptional activator of dmlA